MNIAFIFLWMIFFHIVDDFVLQAPCLCSLKQKSRAAHEERERIRSAINVIKKRVF